jgi:hypothetical protein
MKTSNKYFYSLLFIFTVFCAEASTSSRNLLIDLANKIGTSDSFMSYANHRANIVFCEMANEALLSDKEAEGSKEELLAKFNDFKKLSYDKGLEQYKQLQMEFPELLNLTDEQISETLKMAYETEKVSLFFRSKMSCIGKKIGRFFACNVIPLTFFAALAVAACFSSAVAVTILAAIANPVLLVIGVPLIEGEAMSCAVAVGIATSASVVESSLTNCGTQLGTDIYDCVFGN